MGYTTDFYGQIEVVPPLNQQEIEYLKKFNETRRMDRANGPYFVDGAGDFGQDHGPDEIYNGNAPHKSQPGLWCQWVPTDDGKYIEWDGGEKFHDSTEWMRYIIAHFIGTNPIAKGELPFLQGHVCNGIIEAQGEDQDDKWAMLVANNVVEELVADVTFRPASQPKPEFVGIVDTVRNTHNFQLVSKALENDACNGVQRFGPGQWEAISKALAEIKAALNIKD